MGLRATSYSHEIKEKDPSRSTSFVTSLMKSWKISSSSDSLNNINNNASSDDIITKKSTRSYSTTSQDGNFDAMAKQTASTRKKSSKNHHSSSSSNANAGPSSYSPLRYISPSMSNLESPRSNYYRQHHTRNTHHTQYYHNTNNSTATADPTTSNSAETQIAGEFTNTQNNNNNNNKYFQDLDEDWSAVIDDYNAPIPILINGGKGERPDYSLSRTSTNSSSLQYPQLPMIETRSKLEIEKEIEVQKLNSILQRIAKFDTILNNKHIINLKDLRKISWNGIPNPHRPTVWKLLIGYLPANKNRQKTFLQRKRQEYSDGLKHTFSDQHKRDIPTWHQIEIDIPRTNPHIQLYQFKTVHESLQRILYLWAIRHPASGYVQGINDLVTPFYQTFLSEYLPQSQIDDVENKDPVTYLTESQLKDVEADTFWCLTKLLEQITDNYIHGQPGILKQVKILSQLVKRIDIDLYEHFQNEHVEFIQFAFRWMNCLLMREFQMNAVIRMWDTYLSETSIDTSSSVSTSLNNDLMSPHTPIQQVSSTFTTPPQTNSGKPAVSPHHSGANRFNSVTTLTSLNQEESDITKVRQSSLNEFHVFVCAAFLIKWSDQLCEMDFQEIITFLQNPPTKDWDENDIEMLLSGAYIWQSLYKDATSHWL